MNDTQDTDTKITIKSSSWNRIISERNEAMEKYSTEATEYMLSVNKLCGERDDARNKLADALQEVDLRTLDFERMKQERDEARVVLREIWQSGDAFLPYIDKETTNRWRKAAGWEETKK